jgi:serine/threonine-protein kinase
MELAIGAKIGPYRLVRQLGEGTTSRVFEVEHERIGRRAAMKIAHVEAALPGITNRLFAEAQAVNLINHPHVVDITDIVVPSEACPATALVMELLEGTSLADVVAKRAALPPARLLPIMAQVCDGLAAVHAAGFVHRDLKPENVFLVDRAGTSDFVKLLDFGLVKALRRDLGSARATREGTFMGSPAYMAPEQAQGKSVDHRADIYAVGIMLYELVTGRLPFEAESIGDVLAKQITAPAPRLHADLLATEMGMALDAIIQACLAKDREARVLTAAQLAEMFRKLAAGQRVPAPNSAGGATSAAARRSRRVASIAPVVVALGAFVLFVAAHGHSRGRGDSDGGGHATSLVPRPAAPAVEAPPPLAPVAATEELVADRAGEPKSGPPRSARRWPRPHTVDRATTLDPYR